MSVAVCRRPGAAGEPLNAVCPACCHLLSLHVGTEACPVCELLELLDDFRNRGPQFRRLERIAGSPLGGLTL